VLRETTSRGLCGLVCPFIGAIMAIPSTGLFIVLAVSHGLVTVLETLNNVLRTTNEYEGTFLSQTT
jgi:hypothetical protein